MLKLGFLASHTGSNMQAIIDACQAGTLAAEPRVVISNNSQSGALARARQANIAAYHLSERTHGEALGEAILAAMQRHEVEVICLAGYMKKLGSGGFGGLRRADFEYPPRPVAQVRRTGHVRDAGPRGRIGRWRARAGRRST